MKHLVTVIFIFITILIFSKNASAQKEPDLILMKVSKKLNSIEAIRYDLTRELNYPSQEYLVISEWPSYYCFSEIEQPLRFTFQIEDENSESIYNGTENFLLDKENKTIDIKENPGEKYFESLSFFYNSIITLRNVLPMLIKDEDAIKTVTDSLINNRTFKLVTINIGKRRIQNLGTGFDSMQTEYDFIYEIMIDPSTYLPVEILQKNNLDSYFIKTNFKNINLNPDKPSQNSWYYSTYKSKYKPAENKVVKNLLPIGKQAPNWTLKRLNTKEKVSLSDLKGKVVVIEFWIKNCSYCISSVPHLNKLKNNFKDEKFEILAINLYDSQEDIRFFIDKFNINYSILSNGENVAQQYGVSGYPTLFIIDKSGIVIDSYEGIEENTILQIEKTIKNAL